MLAGLGLPIIVKEYRVRWAADSRAAGETSMIIERRDGTHPRVNINDELLPRETGTREVEEEGTTRDEMEQRINNATSAFNNLRRQGFTPEDARAQMVASLCRAGRSQSAATNDLHVILAITRLRAQGVSLDDALSYMVATLVSQGNSAQAARARVREAFR